MARGILPEIPPPGEVLTPELYSEAQRIRRKRRKTQAEIEWLGSYEERLQQPLPGGGTVETTTTQSTTVRQTAQEEETENRMMLELFTVVAKGQNLASILQLMLKQFRESNAAYKELARMCLDELKEMRRHLIDSDRSKAEAYLAIARARAAQEQAIAEEKPERLIPEATVDGILKGAAKKFGLLEEEGASSTSSTRATNGKVDPGDVGERLGEALASLQFQDDDIREVLELVQSKYDKLTGE